MPFGGFGATVGAFVGNYINSYATDIVAVYTPDFNQVFQNARPIKATIKQHARLMKQPLENGATVVDHRIILPIEIELSLVLNSADYIDVYQQIQQLFSTGESLVVQTRSGIFQNQVIASLPTEESPDMYDTLSVALKLQEIQYAGATVTIQPKNPPDTPTSDNGNQQPTTPTNQSGANELFGNWFKNH